MIRAIAFCVAVLIAADAWACSRCGLFGSRCRFASQHHEVAAVVAAPVIAQPPISIINNYAPGNGAAATLIAPQGGSVYGLSTAVQAYSLDPAAVLRQAAELTRGAQQLADQGLKGYGQTAALALTLQASQPAIQAAVVQPIQQPPQTLQIELRDGKWQIVQPTAAKPSAPDAPYEGTSDEPVFGFDLKTGKVMGKLPNGVVPRPPKLPTTPPAPAADPPQRPASAVSPARGFPLINKHCGKCHGVDIAAPKGGVYLGGEEVDCKINLSAVAAVLSGRMPPGSQLSQQDRQGIVLELSEAK
jgi:mono/diheme cytochrome c family protein